MRVRPLGLAAGIILLPLIAAAQTPPRDQPAEAIAGTAGLRGRVVAAEGGSPLRRAQVRASSSTNRTTRLTSTDAEGRYELRNLPSGRYTISVSKAGYVALEFGQTRPFDSGRLFDLADGQVAESIDFALPRGGVITGRITDEGGDPVIGAWVQAMRYTYLPGGRRQLGATGNSSWLSGRTDDLGEFRLFGLMPGTYVVSALYESTGIVSLTDPDPQSGGVRSFDARDGQVQTFYPGTANVAEAQAVSVNLSDEAQASFALVTARKSRLSGVARRSDGRALSTGSMVILRPDEGAGGAMGSWGNSSVAADGSFIFANVPPGRYIIEVTPPRQTPSADSTASNEFARMLLTVGGSDLAGLTLTTRPGVSVSGRVLLPAGHAWKSADGSPARINATPFDFADYWRGGNPLNNGAIDENGRFQIRDVMGNVVFRIAGAPPRLVLKSVTLNGADITDKPYDTTNGDLSGLEVVLAEQAQIVGGARNPRGELKTDFKVALFPASATPGRMTSRFVRTATADPNGRFQIGGLPAGEYLAVAVESFDQGQEWDPAFQQRALPAARHVAVKEGQTLTLELPYVE